MVHVWVAMLNPDGVFADFNRTVPYAKLGLPDSYWQGASEQAARGLNLATEGGCEAADGTLWIATANNQQKRAIEDACEGSAAEVRAALRDGGKARVNRAGEAAWMRFDAAWNRVLTPAQKARVAAMSEHGSDGHGSDHHVSKHHEDIIWTTRISAGVWQRVIAPSGRAPRGRSARPTPAWMPSLLDQHRLGAAANVAVELERKGEAQRLSSNLDRTAQNVDSWRNGCCFGVFEGVESEIECENSCALQS